MKKLSDYKGDEAIELWGDLIPPITAILSDSDIKEASADKDRTIASLAGVILKKHPKEVKDIMLRIDNTELNGLNIAVRFIGLLTELQNSEEFGSFFSFAE